MSAPDVFRRFVAAINDHDAAAIAARMTPDHTLVDGLGNRVEGSAAAAERSMERCGELQRCGRSSSEEAL